MSTMRYEVPVGGVPGEVCAFLRHLKRALRDQNVAEISTLYEYGFTDMTERFFKNKSLPDEESVVKITASDPTILHDSLFVMLYKELYYRVVYARTYRVTLLSDRIGSYYNYMSLFEAILKAEEPLRLNLPDQWIWDLIDEFIYQFHAFCQYRMNGNKLSSEDLHELKSMEEPIWDLYNVVDVLYALLEKVGMHFNKANAHRDAEEFARHPLYYKLAYFGQIGLLRLHTLLGEYRQAILAVERIDFSPVSLYNSVPSCQVTLHFYLGFCHLMGRNYHEATRLFVDSLLYIQRTRSMINQQTQQKTWQYDTVGRVNDQMYQLLAICMVLQPQRIEENIQSELYKQMSDKIGRMQRGELSEFELAFQSGCPRFLTPPVNRGDVEGNKSKEAITQQTKVFMDEMSQQILIPILRGCLKLYSVIKLSKLSSFMDKDCPDLTSALLCYKVCGAGLISSYRPVAFKHKMYNANTAGSVDEDSTFDIDFYINKDMVHIADTTVARRYGEYFIRHIQKLTELNKNLPKISGRSFKARYAEMRENRR